MFIGGGIFGLLVLIVVIYALIRVLQSGMEPGMKLVWVLVILFLPLLGSILYFVIGEKR